MCICVALTDRQEQAYGDEVHRTFVDDFAPCAGMVDAALLDMQKSIKVDGGVDQLRLKNLLNPANEGGSLQLPARMSVRIPQRLQEQDAAARAGQGGGGDAGA
jgi:hypothetical protein